ncbi:MAG: MCE family protein [Acidimicrobiales bacterium]
MAAAVLSAGCNLALNPSTYTVKADFTRTIGLFPSSHVQVLGLDVGTVGTVRNVGNHVEATLRIDRNVVLPAGARAAVNASALLGQRSVELSPGYTGGPILEPGSVIPLSRTSVPVETNQLLREMSRYLGAIKPANAKGVVVNLAKLLHGQGQQLNQLIANASGTIQLLAANGNSLGRMNASLAQLTGALDTRTAAISKLITSYDSVSQVVAQNGAQLNSAITEMEAASVDLSQVLTPNLRPIETDVATITTVGRTLDRNISSLDTTMASSVRLFSAVGRAYSPTHNWLRLNNQTPPGLTVASLEAEIRDRLAGVCRRILANHSAGLPPSAIQQLKDCGNQYSGYFNPILGILPGILDKQPGATTPPPSSASPASMFSAGLAKIPGMTTSERQAVARSAAKATSGSSTGTTGGPASNGSPAAGSTTTTTVPASQSPLPNLPPLPQLHSARQANGSAPWSGIVGVVRAVLGTIGGRL